MTPSWYSDLVSRVKPDMSSCCILSLSLKSDMYLKEVLQECSLGPESWKKWK